MNFRLGSVSIDPIELGSRGNAVLGIRDSGKTVTAKVLGEHLHDAGIPLVVFDPSGMWRFLRVPGKGKGRPVVVAGGKDGDLPLTPASAPKIVEAAMQAGLSLVLHLDMSLSKTDWRAIVRDSVRLLMQRNSEFGLRHVILEEAAEFVPQVVRGDIATVYMEVERMIRIGGNAGLGCTLVNQRAEEVNKAVLELCDNLFLHRQKGKNSLNSLTKWLDVGAVKDGKAIIDTLSTLPSGECWAWLHGSDLPVRIKVPMCDSFHPNRRDLRAGNVAAKVKPVPMEGFVEKLRAQLPAIEEQRKANDPAELKKQIADLQKQLKAVPAPGPLLPDKKVLDAEYQRGCATGFQKALSAVAVRHTDAQSRLRHLMGEIGAVSEALAIQIAVPKEFQRVDIPHKQAVSGPTAPTPRSAQPPAPPPPRRGTNGSSENLPRGEKACLICATQQDGGATREQLTVVTGYKRSSRDAYVQRLREKGYVVQQNDRVIATDEGIAALGSDYQPMPTGEALREFHLQRLPEGERRVLELLISAHPESVAKETIDETTGYKRSSRDAYLQRLSARQLVTGGRGEVRASDQLF